MDIWCDQGTQIDLPRLLHNSRHQMEWVFPKDRLRETNASNRYCTCTLTVIPWVQYIPDTEHLMTFIHPEEVWTTSTFWIVQQGLMSEARYETGMYAEYPFNYRWSADCLHSKPPLEWLDKDITRLVCKRVCASPLDFRITVFDSRASISLFLTAVSRSLGAWNQSSSVWGLRSHSLIIQVDIIALDAQKTITLFRAFWSSPNDAEDSLSGLYLLEERKS